MRNENKVDRALRLIAGFFLLIIGLAGHGAWAITLSAIAAILIVTGVTGFCPLYKLVGYSSCRR